MGEFKVCYIAILIMLLDLIDVNSMSEESALIKQSTTCTSFEIKNQIQCFQEIPKSKYEVPLGSTATLQCVVKNQNGKVQWRAVPVLLGYDRIIPGKPRYRYVGETINGEHHLEIRNVTKEDAGCYECQVQPVGDRHPLLRRKTELIVLIRPSEPKIFYFGVMPGNDRVIINSMNMANSSEFLCISHNGSPPPTFKWFINDSPIAKGVENVSTSRSKMYYSSTSLKDTDVIKCRVSNDATRQHHDPYRQYIDHQVQIVIHTPPGRPKIYETKRGRYTEGEILRGNCTSKPAGNPEGSIVWRWKMPKSQELYSAQRGESAIKDISPQYYQQIIKRNELSSSIDLPPLSSQYHGAQLVCVVVNSVISYQSAVINVTVKYPPSDVKITTSDGSLVTKSIGTDGLTETIIFGESGEQKTITCTTAPFYTEVKIKWQMYYSSSFEDIFPKNMSFAPTENMWIEGYNYRRNSTINVTIDKRYDKAFIECQALSDEKRVDSKVKLDITYPPEKPTIDRYQKNRTVKINQAIELTCSVVGGNPYPELHWFKAKTYNEEINDNLMAHQVGNKKSVTVTIIPTMEDNNVKYFCQAKTVSLRNAKINSEEIILVVYFPPRIIRLSSLSDRDVDEGDTLRLQCLVDESNPPVDVRWKINRCLQMTMELRLQAEQENCEESLTNSLTKMLPGHFGGMKVESNVTIRTTWNDHLTYVDCVAYNSEYPEERYVLSKRMQLNVTFTPRFKRNLDTHIVMEENQSSNVTLISMSNPPIYRYKWLKDSLELETMTKTVTGSKSTLVINSVSSTDSGNYTLIIRNDRGEASFSFNLNVTYPPIILGEKFEKVFSKETNAKLECNVRANPTNPDQSFRWVMKNPTGGYNGISSFGETQEFSLGCNHRKLKDSETITFKYYSKCNIRSQFEMNSLFVVYNVNRNDVGYYECIVNNGVGGSVTKRFELIINFTPQILSLPKYAKAASKEGEPVSIYCYIRAEPQPTISWYFGKYNFTITGNTKYRINLTRQRPGLYVTELMVKNLRRSEHGKYLCKAENEKGSDTMFIDVTGTSKPDIPMEVQVVNRSLTSVTISWIQGFDGGSPQTFQVRWKENKQSSLFRYEDVAGVDSMSTLDFIINGLKADTIYYVSVNSRNTIHGKSPFTTDIEASTLNSVNEIDQAGYQPIEDNKLQDNTVLFIVAASVFGFVILVVNVLVIIFVLRRRRKRSRTAKMEARYKNPKSLLAASNGLILSSDDHLRNSNSNFLRSDAVELYPRGLDTSQMSNHSHHLHSHRRSIGDDQKTFSSVDTGSDDAREDLLRRQHEFGCYRVDSNNKKGPVMLAFDPVTNSSYYAPISSTSSTPIYIQPGKHDQDTLSTLLSPLHEDSERQLMTYMNMMAFNGQRDSSSCGSINSGGTQHTGQYVLNSISPCSSIIAQDPRSQSSADFVNNHSVLTNVHNDNSNRNNAPYRTRIVSPTFLGYSLTAQQRDSYANELRKAQLAANLLVNPGMFSRNSTTNSQVMINHGSLLSSPVNHPNRQFIPQSHPPSSVHYSEHQLNSSNVDSKFGQKYQCTDNQNQSKQNPLRNTDSSVEFVNSALEDSTHLEHNSQYLPRPDLI